MKCTKCDKEAEYIVDGQSVCKEHKEHKEDKPEREEGTMGDRLVGW
ncbi:hypothetical protein LCGC14_2479970 [marine sediment metagenome]|uniref:Uncharacterized protein n=1 Tax=marine sediment metagenome TaxID=412755 RepID=A0A0F9E1I8_9ZZZZ